MKIIILNSFTEFVKDHYLPIGISLIVLGFIGYMIYRYLQQFDHIKCNVYKEQRKKVPDGEKEIMGRYVPMYVYKHKTIKNFAYYRPDGMSLKLTDQQCRDLEQSHQKNIKEGRTGKHDIPEFWLLPYDESDTIY